MLRNLSNLLRVTRPGQVALEQRCRALHSLRDNAQDMPNPGLAEEHSAMAYAAAFSPNFRLTEPLPPRVTPHVISSAAGTYGQLGFDKSTLLSLLDDNITYNLDRLSAAQISGVSYSLFRLGVHSPELQTALLRSAMGRPHEFEPLDLERLRYVSQVCATPAGPGHFHDNPGDEF